MSNSKNPAERMQSIHDSLSRAVYQKVQERRETYRPEPIREAKIEELPDQNIMRTRGEIESASRDTEAHDADGTNYDDWEAERSESGKKQTHLNITDADGEEIDVDGEDDEESELVESFKAGKKVKVIGDDDRKGQIGKIRRFDKKREAMTVEFDDNKIESFGMDEVELVEELSINEAVESFLAEGFSKKQLDMLKMAYAKVNKVDPSSPVYKKLIKKLDDMDKDMLKQVADADIKFVSLLAKNRLRNLKEDTELLEAKIKVGDKVKYARGSVLPWGSGVVKKITKDGSTTLYTVDGGRGFTNTVRQKEIKLDESELSESVQMVKKIAKSGKDTEIKLDDDEEFELDGDVAKALVSKASDNDIKKALKDYESMMKLINKVLR